MPEHNHLPNFKQAVLPHLDATYNLARWLTRNEQDALDVAVARMHQQEIRGRRLNFLRRAKFALAHKGHEQS